jgi:hypothetical protein
VLVLGSEWWNDGNEAQDQLKTKNQVRQAGVTEEGGKLQFINPMLASDHQVNKRSAWKPVPSLLPVL